MDLHPAEPTRPQLGRLAANGSAVSAAALFAASLIIIRAIVPAVGPAKLAAIRFLVGALCLWALAAYRKQAHVPARRWWGRIAVMGFLYFACFPVLLNWGLLYTTASRGALMIASAPVWSALIARAAGQERLSSVQILGTLLTIVGVALCTSGDGAAPDATSPLVGDLMILGAAGCGAGYAVLGRPVVREISAVTTTLYSMAFGAFLLIPLAANEALSAGLTLPPARDLLGVLFVATLGGGLAFFLWTAGLSRLSPTALSVYGNLIPVFAAILGWVFLSETLERRELTALVTVIAGVWLVSGRKPRVVDAS